MISTTTGWIFDNKVEPSATLAQGDLINFPNAEDPLKSLGIVVTADCDIKRKKHAKVVTLVPVVDVKTLMENYLLLEDCEVKRPEIESFTYRKFGIDKEKEDALNKINLEAKIKSEKNPKSIELLAAKFAIDQLPSISIRDYKELMREINSSTKQTKSIHQQITSRGDLFVLPGIPEFNTKNNIAWLRHIWQEQLSAIALRTSETKNRSGEKIARLNSPYRYRLTQLMAQVFSDIGLPDIEHNIENHIKELYENA